MQIDAAVLRAADAPYTIEPLDLAAPGPGEILVKIAGAGMCHTDMLGRVPGDLVAKPVVLGHEGSGTVEAVGPGVTGVAEGDHVVMSFDSCGTCDTCRAALPGACPQMTALNMLAMPLDGTPRATGPDGELGPPTSSTGRTTTSPGRSGRSPAARACGTPSTPPPCPRSSRRRSRRCAPPASAASSASAPPSTGWTRTSCSWAGR
ncbi:alcohol dehydrogenase catalytic domain-containing protein [Actinomadura madurae]